MNKTAQSEREINCKLIQCTSRLGRRTEDDKKSELEIWLMESVAENRFLTED